MIAARVTFDRCGQPPHGINTLSGPSSAYPLDHDVAGIALVQAMISPRMRPLHLSTQLALAVLGLLLVVGALVTWNLVITRQLTEAHRSLADSAIPAVRLEVGLLENVAALRRTEGRYAILRDPAFLAAFQERVQATTGDLDRLAGLLRTPVEQDLLHEA